MIVEAAVLLQNILISHLTISIKKGVTGKTGHPFGLKSVKLTLLQVRRKLCFSFCL